MRGGVKLGAWSAAEAAAQVVQAQAQGQPSALGAGQAGGAAAAQDGAGPGPSVGLGVGAGEQGQGLGIAGQEAQSLTQVGDGLVGTIEHQLGLGAQSQAGGDGGGVMGRSFHERGGQAYGITGAMGLEQERGKHESGPRAVVEAMGGADGMVGGESGAAQSRHEQGSGQVQPGRLGVEVGRMFNRPPGGQQLTAAQVDFAHEQMGFGAVGFEGEGLGEDFLGFAVAVEFEQQIGQGQQRFGVVGLTMNLFEQVHAGALALASLPEQVAQLQMGVGMLGFQPQDALPAPDGLVDALAGGKALGEVLVAQRALVADQPGQVEHLLGLVVLLEHGVGENAVAVGGFAVGVDAGKLFKGVDGFTAAADLDEVDAKVFERLLIAAAQSEHAAKAVEGFAVAVHGFEGQAHAEVPFALTRIDADSGLEFGESLAPQAVLEKLLRAFGVLLGACPVIHAFHDGPSWRAGRQGCESKTCSAPAGSENRSVKAWRDASMIPPMGVSLSPFSHGSGGGLMQLWTCLGLTWQTGEAVVAAVGRHAGHARRVGRIGAGFGAALLAAGLWGCAHDVAGPSIGDTAVGGPEAPAARQVVGAQAADAQRGAAPSREASGHDASGRDVSGGGEKGRGTRLVELLDRSSAASVARRARQLAEAEGSSLAARHVVAVLAAGPDRGPSIFRDPLIAALGDSSLASDLLADALTRYGDDGLVERLRKVIRDADSSQAQRLAAAAVLGRVPLRSSVNALVDLLDDEQPVVRAAADAALVRVSGITAYAGDAPAWRSWQRRHRRMDESAWAGLLAAGRQRLTREESAEASVMRQAAVDLHARLYHLTAQDQRPELLAAMLADPVAAIRLLAIDLVRQRVLDLGPDQVAAPLRSALVRRLDDSNAQVQRGAVLLLRDLADATGADAAARRLAAADEGTSRSLVEAYLLLLARVPQATAVEPAMRLLDDPDLDTPAASALSSAIEVGLVSERERGVIRTLLRDRWRSGGASQPRLVRLYGQVADEDDWNRVEGWLDSEDAAVREAAARAWAGSRRPLAVLVSRAGDPVIEPIYLAAAAEHGQRGDVLEALAGQRPGDATMTEAWAEALVRMAGRVAPSAVLAADARLRERGEPATVRLRLLSSAIDRYPLPAGDHDEDNGTGLAGDDGRPAGVAPADGHIGRLLLARADLRRQEGDASSARADYQRAARLWEALGERDRLRCELGLVEASLAGGELDAAVAAVRRSIERAMSRQAGADGAASAGAKADMDRARTVADRLLDAAIQHMEAGEMEAAGVLLDGLTEAVNLAGPAFEALRREAASARRQHDASGPAAE